MKTTLRFHLTLAKMAIVKKPTEHTDQQGSGRLATPANGNVNWPGTLGKQQGGPLKLQLKPSHHFHGIVFEGSNSLSLDHTEKEGKTHKGCDTTKCGSVELPQPRNCFPRTGGCEGLTSCCLIGTRSPQALIFSHGRQMVALFGKAAELLRDAAQLMKLGGGVGQKRLYSQAPLSLLCSASCGCSVTGQSLVPATVLSVPCWILSSVNQNKSYPTSLFLARYFVTTMREVISTLPCIRAYRLLQENGSYGADPGSRASLGGLLELHILGATLELLSPIQETPACCVLTSPQVSLSM